MPTSPRKRTPPVTRRSADATPPDIDERLRQLAHHQRSQADPEPPPGEAPADLPESAPPVLPREPSAPPDPPPSPDRSAAAPSKRARNERQAQFLTANRNKVVTLFLMNSIRLTGRLTGHDDFVVILLGRDGKETLTYQHAISTVVPSLPPASPPRRQE